MVKQMLESEGGHSITKKEVKAEKKRQMPWSMNIEDTLQPYSSLTE